MNFRVLTRIFLFFILIQGVIPVQAKKKDKKCETKSESVYTKFFKEKKHETVRGLFAVHKMDGRVYFEIPFNLLGEAMLLGSTIHEITDNRFGSVGEKPYDPIPVVFVKVDSILSLCQLNLKYTTSEENLQERIDESSKPAVLSNFKIECYTPDSSAVVADVTDYFLADNDLLGPFSAYAPITAWGERWIEKEIKKENSQIGKIRAFDDNVSVLSSLSYLVNVRDQSFYYVYKMPFTAMMNRSFIRLPEKVMRPRYADPRIGVFTQGQSEFSSTWRGVRSLVYAQRWRLEPSDEAKYRKGELVEPTKPIVFYVDDAFPENWKKNIKKGVEQWQDAFEKIGFKNAIVAKDYPKNDPEFDPNNLKYSCIIYSPSRVANAMGPSWCDPRSGEILNASVYLYHDLIKLVQDWRFVQTAPADPCVRKMVLDEETLGDCIRYVVSHEVGHCLAFMHNMSGSAAIPTDSLRSPQFTQKYGTTYSIMDYARNNYVAQPGDKERGVKLTPPDLGVYDYYLVHWLYAPILDASSSKDEVRTLNSWISEKAGDPIYRYGKQQFYMRLDPSSFEEDLGDDAIKSATYGIQNLKYVLKNLNDWVGHEDADYHFRENIYNEIVYQYCRYLVHVVYNVGGIYVNERYDGDRLPSFSIVAKEKQKRALDFMLQQIKDLAWLNDREVMQGFPLQSNIVPDLEDAIYEALLARFEAIAICASKATQEVYSQLEYMNDIYVCIWRPTQQSRTLSGLEKKLQLKFLSYLLESSGTLQKGLSGMTLNFCSPSSLIRIPEYVKCKSRDAYGLLSPDVLGIFSNQEGIWLDGKERAERGGFGSYLSLDVPSESMNHLYFSTLKKTLNLLENRVNTGSEDTRQHYRLMIYKVKQALEK